MSKKSVVSADPGGRRWCEKITTPYNLNKKKILTLKKNTSFTSRTFLRIKSQLLLPLTTALCDASIKTGRSYGPVYLHTTVERMSAIVRK